MKRPDVDRLYNLLPSIYRQKDIAKGQPLRALLAVIENELRAIEDDIEGLYRNYFIETCDEWAVPYIGDLLGIRGFHPGSPGIFSQRAYVGNTLAYRRRKGTATMLEQLARDTTGWNARVVEFFQLLSTTQHMNHIRPSNVRTPDLRDNNRLELMDGPFEDIPHTIDVGNIERNRGKYNIPNVGLFLWRLQSYRMEETQLHRVTSHDNASLGCYTFHPLGYDCPLFTRLETETEITHLAEEINVPGPIRRLAFGLDLNESRNRFFESDGNEPPSFSEYYGENRSVDIEIDKNSISPLRAVSMDLSTWASPPEGKVGIDVELGRLTFDKNNGFVVNKEKPRVTADFNYGFSADTGGGAYPCYGGLTVSEDEAYVIEVCKGTEVDTLQKAKTRWEEYRKDKKNIKKHKRLVGVIRITDSSNYGGSGDTLDFTLPDNSLLIIEAAGTKRPFVKVVGTMEIDIDSDDGSATFSLCGIYIEATIQVGKNVDLLVNHCTIVTGLVPEGDAKPNYLSGNAIQASKESSNASVTISKSIVGPIRLPVKTRRLTIRDSIVDAPSVNNMQRPAIAENDDCHHGPPTIIERSTIFGHVHVKELEMASESIFLHPVSVERIQAGCVRYSYLPEGSRTPRRFHCQPDEALKAANGIAEKERIRALLKPAFTSKNLGNPAYAQLSRLCAGEISTGAEDGSEMGVFYHLKQPQREANLRESLDEYLRFGLNAGIFFVT